MSTSEQFFDLALDDKLASMPLSADIHRGYARKGSESRTYSLGGDAASRPTDLFEAFNKLLDVFAPALRLGEGWFGPFATHSPNTMRLIHYETQPRPRPEDEGPNGGAQKNGSPPTAVGW